MSILKQIFGPSKEEVYRNLCQQIGGDFLDGGLWRGDKVQARVGEWVVTLDTYSVSDGKTTVYYTRMRAPYINPDGFHFKIFRKNIFSEVGRLLGMQDIRVGYPQFDHDFIIKGNDEEKVRQLFANPRIRELIEQQPSISFQVKDDEGWFGPSFPEGVDELYFSVRGVIKDVDRLRSLFGLFAEMLNQLCHMGSAYEDDPGINLRE